MLFAVPLAAMEPEIRGVPRVIDADTFEIRGQRIRVGGIDAPEMRERCARADGRSWACGQWATDQTRALLRGRELRCIDLGERTHNRMVGRCYLEGRDVALTLIEMGAARSCGRFARAQGRYDAYRAAEQVAVAARAGIFGGPLNPTAGFCLEQYEREQVAATCTIKGNVNRDGERIYHRPGQQSYDRINMNHAEKRWFCSSEDARAAGWRPALR